MEKPKILYNSPVILTFTLISLLVLIIGTMTNGASTMLLFSVYRSPLSDPLFYIRLFGHAIGHANLEHYVSNFLIILLVGPMIEEKYKSRNLIIMMLFTAFITGIIHIIMSPNSVLLGASGIVFMLILLSSFTNVKEGQIPMTLIFVAVVYIGQEVMSGILAKDNISHITHILGGICGGVFGFVLMKKRGKT